jgi:hypothetical protein
MNSILKRLGVPPDIQAFFNCPELIFNYGGDAEHFGLDFHRVPTTRHLYLAGAQVSRELILTSSVMEGIAFLTFNIHHYPTLENLSVIALGNLPHTTQLNYISAGWQKNKINLVFGNDLLGRLTDIKVATGIRNKTADLYTYGDQVAIEYNHIHYRFSDTLTLNKFEKTTGFRSGFCTGKPKKFNTFLDQLKNDAT